MNSPLGTLRFVTGPMGVVNSVVQPKGQRYRRRDFGLMGSLVNPAKAFVKVLQGVIVPVRFSVAIAQSTQYRRRWGAGLAPAKSIASVSSQQ